MPVSHECPVCSKVLKEGSLDELMVALEHHLIDHVESMIEISEDFLEDLDPDDNRDVIDTDLAQVSLDPDILENDGSSSTQANSDDYDTMANNYSEDQQYGDIKYKLDSTELMYIN